MIGVGSAVKAKVGESEKITREGINRRMRKEVVVCLQTVVGEKKSIVKLVMFRRKISSYSLVFLSLKYEVEMDESLSHYTKTLTRRIIDYCWGSWGWRTLNFWKRYVFVCLLLIVL